MDTDGQPGENYQSEQELLRVMEVALTDPDPNPGKRPRSWSRWVAMVSGPEADQLSRALEGRDLGKERGGVGA
jgi:hypothetical protein